MYLTEPKEVKWEKEKSNITFPVKVFLPGEWKISPEAARSVWPGAFALTEREEETQIRWERKDSLEEQAYEIWIGEDEITIFASAEAGGFYGLMFLGQLRERELYQGKIKNAPDLRNRGFMLDISRDKVPTVETVKQLTDLLVRCGYNQLQLYIEGGSFAYPSFPQMWKEDAALQPEEISEIDAYCRERFIELVPNQNSLGHMGLWLAMEEFIPLAECEGGFSFGGFLLPPTTLDPADPGSLKLMERLTDELLGCFTSNKMHAGLDEPFELGQGKTKDKDVRAVFIGYMKKLNELVKSRGRSMMMWADALHRFDGISADLPDDVIYMEWGYEKEHPFDERCRKFYEAGKRFYVCPGSSSWNSFTGMTDNMTENIDRAVEAAVKYQAEGILLTDWGDNHHMQYLPVTYPAIAYCGMRAWNTGEKPSEEALSSVLDEFIFQDRAKKMGHLALSAGRSYQLEEQALPCKTLAATVYANGIKNLLAYQQCLRFSDRVVKTLTPKAVADAYEIVTDRMSETHIRAVEDSLQKLRAELRETDMACGDQELIREEFDNGIAMVLWFTRFRERMLADEEQRPDEEARAEAVRCANEELRELIEKHQRLWLARNKAGGVDKGIAQMMTFEEEE